MFDQNSRYRSLPVATASDGRGHSRTWVTLRLVGAPMPSIAYAVQRHERLDLLAARAYADPTMWWRIADANVERVTGPPHELVAVAGTVIALAQPVRADVMPR